MVTQVRPTADPRTDKPPCGRRWIPLSLRMFVVMLVLTSVGGGLWVGLPAYRQHVAIQEFERRGAAIGNFMPDRPVTGPIWLRRIIGDERMVAFDEIDDVYFHADSATVDRRIAKIHAEIISMSTVSRDPPSIDDSTLSYITGIPSVKNLSLRLCNVGDTGMEHVACLRKLEHLDLFCTDVADAGLARLKTLRNLRSINLHGTNVTDEGIADLQRELPQLKIYR